MSFASLLDHVARVWRYSTTKGALREEVRTWVQIGDETPAAVRRPVARIGDAGPGDASIGERVLYLPASVDVRERDVIELVSGPDSGRFEVDGPPTSPRGHHIEVRCRLWLGALP